MDHPASADPDAIYRRPATPEPPALPAISDYWPDAPHRIGPPADHYSEEPTASAVDALLRSRRPAVTPPVSRPPQRPGKLRAAIGVTLAALLLGGTGVILARLYADADPKPAAAPKVAEAPAPNAVSAPLEGADKAGFELVSDTSAFALKTADLGADLYRISTPQGSSVVPRAAVQDDVIRLFLDRSGKRGDEAVEVQLNQDVHWRLTMTGGVKRATIDLGGAKIDGVNLVGGATRIELTLPRPDGTLPIRMSGGVNEFEVRTADAVPVRVRTRRGAGQVKLGGRTDDGVARGASFSSKDWAASKNRIDLDAVAGIGTLNVAYG